MFRKGHATFIPRSYPERKFVGYEKIRTHKKTKRLVGY